MTTSRTAGHRRAAITLLGICTPVAASVLAADVAPRGIWHYLGNDAKLAHANPDTPGQPLGPRPAGPPRRQDTGRKPPRQRPRDLASTRRQGDWRSARAACRFATVYRNRVQEHGRRRRGGPIMVSVPAGPVLRNGPGRPRAGPSRTTSIRSRCGRTASRRPRLRTEIQAQRPRTSVATSSTWTVWTPSARTNAERTRRLMGTEQWHRRQVRKARTSWQAAIDGGILARDGVARIRAAHRRPEGPGAARSADHHPASHGHAGGP